MPHWQTQAEFKLSGEWVKQWCYLFSIASPFPYMFLESLSMFLACWECQMLRDANSKPLWRCLWYPPATEINFWVMFAKSSNFLLSPISSQEKINARCNRCPTYLRLWSLSTLCLQISGGAPAYVNLQRSELLCFPGELVSALHLQDFKGEGKVIFLLIAPISLSSASGHCQS